MLSGLTAPWKERAVCHHTFSLFLWTSKTRCLEPYPRGTVVSEGPWMGVTDVFPSITIKRVNFGMTDSTMPHTSAYGFSSWIEKSEGVADANLAAAELFPTLPENVSMIRRSRLSWCLTYPIHNYWPLKLIEYTDPMGFVTHIPHCNLSSGTCMSRIRRALERLSITLDFCCSIRMSSGFSYSNYVEQFLNNMVVDISPLRGATWLVKWHNGGTYETDALLRTYNYY